ncbi:MAG: hypothetical protein ABIH00_09335 [Armatimonadota bacterium]
MRFLKYAITVTVLVGIVFAASFFIFKTPVNSADMPYGKFGVVELDKLIEAHPDYDKLVKLNEQLMGLQEQLDMELDPLKSVAVMMEKKQQQAAQQLGEELLQIQKRLQKEQAELGSQMEAEKNQIVEQIKILQSQGPSPEELLAPPKKVTSQTLQQSLDQFVKDLIAFKEKQVAAKRLELQKKLTEELRGIKEKQRQELSAYEREIQLKNQNEKINLVFKRDNAVTPEEREEVINQLKALNARESHLAEIKQLQLDKKFEEYKLKRVNEIEREVARYNEDLEKDVMAQIKGKGLYEKYSSKKELSSPQYKYAKQKLEEKRVAYQKQVEELSAKYEKQFEDKRIELQKKLEKQEKELVEKAMDKKESLDKLSDERRKELEKQIEILEEQRDRLYDEIISSISQKVGKAAIPENISYVVGEYILDIDAVDLTKQVMEME